MTKDRASVREEALDRLDGILALRKRDKKLETLLSDFPDGCTAGWHVAVPACFRDALDIKWTERKKDKVGEWKWIQASAFSFRPGDTLYDSPKAYGTWAGALGQLRFALVVTDASPAVPAKPASVAPETAEDVPRAPGVVAFDVLEPNEQRTALVRTAQQTLSQDEFVRFLVCGRASSAP
ncbi:hypothetical protein HQ560_16020 [bacterium]|nr:hypothetical protein [bacterium]